VEGRERGGNRREGERELRGGEERRGEGEGKLGSFLKFLDPPLGREVLHFFSGGSPLLR